MYVCRGLREGLDLLCRAYDADPGQPGVLTLLARFCIQRGDWQRARELAAAAHAAAESEGTRALALTLQARAHHAEGNYNHAYRSYQQVLALSCFQSRVMQPAWLRSGHARSIALLLHLSAGRTDLVPLSLQKDAVILQMQFIVVLGSVGVVG